MNHATHKERICAHWCFGCPRPHDICSAWGRVYHLTSATLHINSQIENERGAKA